MVNEIARFATVTAGGKRRWGLVRDNGFADLSVRHSEYASLKEVIEANGLQRLADAGAGLPLDFAMSDLTYEIPIAAPQKIICIGVNYPDRNEEYKDGLAAAKYPSIFLRFPTSFTGHEQPLIRPPESGQLDYEGEVTLIIGKAGRRIAEKDAFTHIAAVTLCNEGTIRDWLRHSKFNVTQGKNFDRSGSIGPWIVPFAGEEQIADIRLTTKVNGDIRQHDRTSRMIYNFRFLISYISKFATLLPGDIIVTGTPTGAGARFDPPIWLKPGDEVEIEAEGIGVLRNPIADEMA